MWDPLGRQTGMKLRRDETSGEMQFHLGFGPSCFVVDVNVLQTTGMLEATKNLGNWMGQLQ